MQAVARLLTEELNTRPPPEWDALLQRFSAAYRVQFLLFRNEGVQWAGEPTRLPPGVVQRLIPPGAPRREFGPPRGPERFPPPAGRDSFGEPPDSHGPPRGPQDRAAAARPPFMVRTDSPRLYWIGLRIPVHDPDLNHPVPSTLLIVSESLRAGGLLFDFALWAWVGATAVGFSVLFWLPLVRSMTRSLAQMTRATDQIADGNFDVRMGEARGDELGALARGINRMAARLAGFVTGQKRFLGDIAHELCSPIARMQLAVGILEQREGGIEKKRIEDLREEVQQMSNLVNELLAFSKASLGAGQVRLQQVPIRSVVERAVRRETTGNADIRIDIAESLEATADPELLLRAISNLLRNAIRYAGQTPIFVSAKAAGDDVEITVADQGPGVPEKDISKLFEPFYRVDSSRNRETGGIGLGLSIVKTCITTCGGSVICRNRVPSGLEGIIRLRRKD